jgi:hypothetical protein
VVLGGAGTSWLAVVFLAEVAEVTDEGQRNTPRRGGCLFLLVGFLCLNVGFLLGVGRFPPGRTRVVGCGVTPGKGGAQRPRLCPLAGRPLVSAVRRLVLATR